MIQPPQEMLENERFSPTADPAVNGKKLYVSDPNGPLYAPKSAQDGAIAKFDYDYQMVAAEDDLCSACGTAMGDRLRVFTQEQGYEPHLHAQCAAYALRACPHLVRTLRCVHVASDTEIDYDDDEYGLDGEIAEPGKPNFRPGADARTLEVPDFLARATELSGMSGVDAIERLRLDDIDAFVAQQAAGSDA